MIPSLVYRCPNNFSLAPRLSYSYSDIGKIDHSALLRHCTPSDMSKFLSRWSSETFHFLAHGWWMIRGRGPLFYVKTKVGALQMWILKWDCRWKLIVSLDEVLAVKIRPRPAFVRGYMALICWIFKLSLEWNSSRILEIQLLRKPTNYLSKNRIVRYLNMSFSFNFSLKHRNHLNHISVCSTPQTDIWIRINILIFGNVFMLVCGPRSQYYDNCRLMWTGG
jgi:hypothetical protein